MNTANISSLAAIAIGTVALARGVRFLLNPQRFAALDYFNASEPRTIRMFGLGFTFFGALMVLGNLVSFFVS